MTATTFLALAVLLLAPGPTNAMLATAAASRGWRAMAPLLAPVGAAYLLSVGGFGALSATLGASPLLSAALKVACAVLLTAVAVGMWRSAGAQAACPVPPARVFIATLANPKGFVIAMGLLPPPGSFAMLAASAAVAATMAVVAAAAWGALGGLLRHVAGSLPPGPVERTGAVTLFAFAALLTGSALA